MEAANYMRAVKGERDCLDKEAALIPGMEANIKQLQTDLGETEIISKSLIVSTLQLMPTIIHRILCLFLYGLIDSLCSETL